jgi:hypothetical protein
MTNHLISTCILLGAVLTISSARAHETNGVPPVSTNGVPNVSTNGVTTPGVSTNGTPTVGVSTNGNSDTNGIPLPGLSPAIGTDTGTNGVGTNGVTGVGSSTNAFTTNSLGNLSNGILIPEGGIATGAAATAGTGAASVGEAFSEDISGQDLYSIQLKIICRPAEGTVGQANKLTKRELIEENVGPEVSAREIKQDYTLVYNASADRIQVINREEGVAVSDVFIFEGGTNVFVGDQLTRFTFMYRPDQAEAIGSAVITEHPSLVSGRARITGHVQFTHAATTTAESGAVLETTGTNDVTAAADTGSTNVVNDVGTGGTFVQAAAAAAAATDVEICTGTFTAGKLIRLNRDSGSSTNSLTGTGN